MHKPGGAEPRKAKDKKSRRFRLRYFVLVFLVCLLAGLLALFASGPVRIPMLGSLLAYQGTRGPVELSVARASVDFTAAAGINIILEDARADIKGASPV
ncbi:MAG: hypothetical protein K5905_26280, partial [Roseibium sp.]|uniref:hypothetical protein n=1 Tax=Roseibium sp. TaxID=1936156 RepID=UPI00261B7E25